MYIAMNRFRVTPGQEAEFEAVWRTRESYLPQMDGFVAFHLLRGASQEDHTLYSSHTLWKTKADFEAWTKSDAFRRAHARAGNTRPLPIAGHPQFEGFEVVLEELRQPGVAA